MEWEEITQLMRKPALFEGLVFNQEGEPAELVYIGDEANYVVLDAGFRRHVPAEQVDLQVIEWFQTQVSANKDFVTKSTMEMLGKDDLFTKAMIDLSIENMAELVDYGLPEDARMWLGMLGFRITVDVHGDVVDIVVPTQEAEE